MLVMSRGGSVILLVVVCVVYVSSSCSIVSVSFIVCVAETHWMSWD